MSKQVNVTGVDSAGIGSAGGDTAGADSAAIDGGGTHGTAIIETSRLCKTFVLGEVALKVLVDVDLAINRGDFVTIMGPSGSGKSTLLYLMGGLDAPTSGRIRIDGTDLSGLSDREQSLFRRRKVGFVFQFYNLVPNLTVEDNVMLPVLLDGRKAREYGERCRQIVESVGLAGHTRHTPRELSGGQQQRVAIARALINEPDIILADEPTGNLDSKTSEEVLALLQRINRERNVTIVQVSHSEEAAAYGNGIIRLRDGKVWNES